MNILCLLNLKHRYEPEPQIGSGFVRERCSRCNRVARPCGTTVAGTGGEASRPSAQSQVLDARSGSFGERSGRCGESLVAEGVCQRRTGSAEDNGVP